MTHERMQGDKANKDRKKKNAVKFSYIYSCFNVHITFDSINVICTKNIKKGR